MKTQLSNEWNNRGEEACGISTATYVSNWAMNVSFDLLALRINSIGFFHTAEIGCFQLFAFWLALGLVDHVAFICWFSPFADYPSTFPFLDKIIYFHQQLQGTKKKLTAGIVYSFEFWHSSIMEAHLPSKNSMPLDWL